MRIVALLSCAGLAVAAARGRPARSAPRIAVISAFEPEWKALKAASRARSHRANGVEFVTGIARRPSGGAVPERRQHGQRRHDPQLALDRFDITGIVVSGIAGGVDPVAAYR